MRIIDFVLVLLTTLCLTANQVLLKIWLEKYSNLFLPLGFDKLGLFFKIEILFSVLAFLIAIIIWLGLLRRIDFGMLYPLISLSYVFGLFAAKFILHEEVPTIRWVGVGIIFLGVFLVTRNP